jgi:hypothetical protein
VAVGVLGLLTPPARRALGPLALVYASACCAASIPAGQGAEPGVRLRIPLVFAAMHIGWGAGFWAGLFEYLRPATGATATTSR